MIAQLELEVQELVGRAQQAENQETKEALNIPAELTRREDRKAALQQARQVSLRGHAKVSLEWTLVCVSYNLKRLFTLKNLAAAA